MVEILDITQVKDVNSQKRKQVSNFYLEFIIANVIVGLQYMHEQGVIHRDIKPENLVFDDVGYVRITDMGIACLWNADNASETSGTPGYMAPEVMC